jgi:hypothetical protein
MKVIIAGSRSFSDYEFLCRICDQLLVNQSDVEIVSGGCYGPDRLGERYAIVRKHKLKQMPANWKSLGKKAGPIRNEEMAKYADALIAFWDGKSKGTMHMISMADKYKLKTRIINYGI